MTSVARSLAARVAVASAPSRGSERKPPTAASRGRRIRGVRAMGYESNIPPTRGQPGRFGDGGGGLILPGDDRYDAGMVKGIPSPSNPGGKSGFDPRTGTGGPGQLPGGYEAPPKPGSEKRAGEAFAPFRPPSEFLDKGEFAAEDDNMSLLRLRQRAGNWFDLAPLFPKLMRSGFLPDDIFDETGIEPREQSLWATWVASRGSLVADPRFPDEKLSYFDQEWNAENLSHIQYLSSDMRPSFAEFVVDNEFNPDQTKELVKSVEIRNAHETQAKGFGRSPGECLAFKMWRDVQEVQRWQGIDAVMELVNDFARIPVCGRIAHYNDTAMPEGPDRLPGFMGKVLVKRLLIKGFIQFDYIHRQGDFLKDMPVWISEGKVKYQEDVVEGLENVVRAFQGLLQGKNRGKLLIQVGDDPTKK